MLKIILFSKNRTPAHAEDEESFNYKVLSLQTTPEISYHAPSAVKALSGLNMEELIPNAIKKAVIDEARG